MRDICGGRSGEIDCVTNAARLPIRSKLARRRFLDDRLRCAEIFDTLRNAENSCVCISEGPGVGGCRQLSLHLEFSGLTDRDRHTTTCTGNVDASQNQQNADKRSSAQMYVYLRLFFR